MPRLQRLQDVLDHLLREETPKHPGSWGEDQLNALQFLKLARTNGIELTPELLKDSERVLCEVHGTGVYGVWLDGSGWIIQDCGADVAATIASTLNNERVTLSTVWTRAETLHRA